jgi:hypothetical protein
MQNTKKNSRKSQIECFIFSIAIGKEMPSNFVAMLIKTQGIANGNFHEDPIRSPERTWMSSGRTILPNDSVIRISPSGGFGF